MDRPPLGLTPEFGVFEALVLVLAGFVVLTVGYDIYQHPVDPQPVGVARVEVSGAGHFRGDIGVEGSTYAIEGEAPAAVVVPFTRSDLVVANMQ